MKNKIEAMMDNLMLKFLNFLKKKSFMTEEEVQEMKDFLLIKNH